MKRNLFKQKRWGILILTLGGALFYSTASFVAKSEEKQESLTKPTTVQNKVEASDSKTSLSATEPSSRSNSVARSLQKTQNRTSQLTNISTDQANIITKQADIVSPKEKVVETSKTQTVLRPESTSPKNESLNVDTSKANSLQTDSSPSENQKKSLNDPFVDSAEKELFQMMADAYIYAFPLVLMNEIEKEMTDSVFFAAVNQMAYIPTLPSPSFKMTECPNVDGLTSVAWLDLSQGAQVICLPKTSNHQFIMEILDAWTNVIDTFSNNQLDQFPIREMDNRQVRCFILTYSDLDKKEIDGIPVIKTSTEMLWLINRVLLGSPRISRESSIAAASRVLYEFEVIPLNVFMKEFKKSDEKAADSGLFPFDSLGDNLMQTAQINPKFATTLSLLFDDSANLPADSKGVCPRPSQNTETSQQHNSSQNFYFEQNGQNIQNDQISKINQKQQNNYIVNNKDNAQISHSPKNAQDVKSSQKTQSKETPQNVQTTYNAKNAANSDISNRLQTSHSLQTVHHDSLKDERPANANPANNEANVPMKEQPTDQVLSLEPQASEEKAGEQGLNQIPKNVQKSSENQNSANIKNSEIEKESDQIENETQKTLDLIEKEDEQSIQNDLKSDDETVIEAEELDELDQPENPEMNLSGFQNSLPQKNIKKGLFSYKKRPLKRQAFYYRNISSRNDEKNQSDPTAITETVTTSELITNSTSQDSKSESTTNSTEKTQVQNSNEESPLLDKWEKKIDQTTKAIENDSQKEESRLEKLIEHAEKTADRIGDDFSEMSDHLYDRTKEIAQKGLDFGKDSIDYFDRKAKRDYHRLAQKIGMMLDAEKWVEHPVNRVQKMSTSEFFIEFAELLKKNPPLAADQEMIAKLAKIGIVPGESFDPKKLETKAQHILRYVAPYAQGKIREAALYGTCRKNLENHWVVFTDLGQYGTDYMRRAIIATEFIGADSASFVLYPYTMVDQDGKFLNGANDYVIHFPAGQTPPVNALWSLTMYDANHYLVPNRLKRYSIRSNEPLIYNEDGSLDLYIQHKEPQEKSSNWLPAPKDDFMLMFRLYLPKESALDGSWQIVPVQMKTAKPVKENQ